MKHLHLFSLVCILTGLLAPHALAQSTSPEGAFDFPREWFYRGDEDAMWTKMSANVGKSVDVLEFKVRDWTGVNPDHGKISPGTLRGRVVVLNFWRTDDELSLGAIPHFNHLFTEFTDQGVEVIGITAEPGSERANDIIEREGIQYVTGRDTFRATGKAFGLEWHPWTVVIDRTGIVRAVGIRPEHVKDAVAQIIAAQPATRESAAKTWRYSEIAEGDGTTTENSRPNAESAEAIPDSWIEAGFERRLTLAEIVGKRPPTLEVDDWRNSFPLKLRERRGEVVLLFFFVVGHPQSTDIAKAINNYYLKKKDEGLTVIGITGPVSGENLTKYISENNFEFRIAVDPYKETINKYQVDTYPDYYFIDRRGILRAADVKVGRIDDIAEILLAESP